MISFAVGISTEAIRWIIARAANLSPHPVCPEISGCVIWEGKLLPGARQTLHTGPQQSVQKPGTGKEYSRLGVVIEAYGGPQGLSALRASGRCRPYVAPEAVVPTAAKPRPVCRIIGNGYVGPSPTDASDHRQRVCRIIADRRSIVWYLFGYRKKET